MSPIKRIRMWAGLTLAEASNEADVHLQAFFLQEKGVYPEILPKILLWAAAKFELDADVLAIEYTEFQNVKRRASGEQWGLSVLELGPPEGNPIIDFRRALGISRMGLAKYFCIHPGLLYRVEQGISRTLPDQLAGALRDAGLSDANIAELRYRIEEVA